MWWGGKQGFPAGLAPGRSSARGFCRCWSCPGHGTFAGVGLGAEHEALGAGAGVAAGGVPAQPVVTQQPIDAALVHIWGQRGSVSCFGLGRVHFPHTITGWTHRDRGSKPSPCTGTPTIPARPRALSWSSGRVGNAPIPWGNSEIQFPCSPSQISDTAPAFPWLLSLLPGSRNQSCPCSSLTRNQQSLPCSPGGAEHGEQGMNPPFPHLNCPYPNPQVLQLPPFPFSPQSRCWGGFGQCLRAAGAAAAPGGAWHPLAPPEPQLAVPGPDSPTQFLPVGSDS